MEQNQSMFMVSKRTSQIITVFLVIVTLFFVAKFIREVKEIKYIGSGTTATNQLSINGTGEAYAVPNIAEITFTVEKEAKTVKEAQDAVTEKSNKALAFLKQNNIADKDIKLVSNNFYPQYDYPVINCFAYPCPQPKQTLRGYNVSSMYSVKIRTIDDSGKIVQGLGDLAVTNLNGPTFTVDDEDGVKNQARDLAIEDAKTKAEALAKSLGVDLVRIVNFSENTNGGIYPMMYARDMKAESTGAATTPAPSFPEGENKYTSNVTITYEIR